MAEVMQIVQSRLPALPSSHGLNWCRQSRKYLNFLHSHLVIVPTDKAANNASFICRNLYIDIIEKELKNSGAYSVHNQTLEQIVKTHQRFLKPKGLFNSKKLGHIYALPKMHKAVPKSRFIAALFKCLTTKLSILLTKCLNLVLDTLRERDDAHICNTGIRRMFVVNGYEEVAEFLQRRGRQVDSNRKSLYTGDFSTMYTTIPHQDLISKLRLCLVQAWNWYATQNGLDVAQVRLMAKGSSC